jgi:peptide/nickel transport system ATP-binding protein
LNTLKEKSGNILELKEVSKFYGYGLLSRARFTAVDSVTLSLGNEPQIFTLAGESGSGKTTLAKIALGIIRPSKGEVLFKGKSLWKLNNVERKDFIRNVQPVFQDPYDTFNPFEKIENYIFNTAKYVKGLEGGRSVLDLVESKLSITGLNYSDIKNKKPRELSGGQLQRLAIARALIAEPKVIIADEPVSMIDVSLRIGILNIFKKIKYENKVSILYITHDLATAYYIADSAAIMFRGSIVEQGDIESIIKDPLHPYTRELIDSIPDPERGVWLTTDAKRQVVELREFSARGCKYAYACPYVTNVCKSRAPPLMETRSGHYVSCWLYHSSPPNTDED